MVVVYAAIDMERFAVGPPMLLQAVGALPPLPAQDAKTGDPPPVDVRQSVPAPPVAVCVTRPVASEYKTPFAADRFLILAFPFTSRAWVGEEVANPTFPVVVTYTPRFPVPVDSPVIATPFTPW